MSVTAVTFGGDRCPGGRGRYPAFDDRRANFLLALRPPPTRLVATEISTIDALYHCRPTYRRPAAVRIAASTEPTESPRPRAPHILSAFRDDNARRRDSARLHLESANAGHLSPGHLPPDRTQSNSVLNNPILI